MLITPSFTEVADDIKPGTYKVRVTGVESKTSQKGDTYLKWELSTFAEEDPKNEGRKMWHSTMISGKGAFMFKRFWNAATGGEDVPAQVDTEMLIGKEMEVVTATNDRGYTEVKATRTIQ